MKPYVSKNKLSSLYQALELVKDRKSLYVNDTHDEADPK